jgi:uncharacterized protein YggE
MNKGGNMKFCKIELLILMMILPFQAYAAENVRKITVTGKSETVLEAQYAIIKIEIKHVKKEMNQSHIELMKTISQLNNELKNIGLTNADIKKTLILQGQEYSWEKDSRVLKGYYSECLVDLYVKNINKISEVYKELANYQNITIQETEYKRNDEFEIRKIEFEKALLAAKKKADYMAQTLDTKIGKVYSIQELSAFNLLAINTYSNVLREEAREERDSKSGYGKIKITALVLVEFELE